jgi:hypothetical protein
MFGQHGAVEVATHMRGKGIVTLVTFLQDPEAVKRLQVLRLLSVLSLLVGVDIATALRSAHQLVRLKELLQAKGKVLLEERVSAANLLANIPLTEFEVIFFFSFSPLSKSVTNPFGSQENGCNQLMEKQEILGATFTTIFTFLVSYPWTGSA